MSRSTPLLDSDQAAKLLGCSKAALMNFRTQRRGPPYVLIGRLVRYRCRDLARWIKSRRVSPESGTRVQEPRKSSEGQGAE